MNKVKQMLMGFLVTAMMLGSMPARAGMIGTEQILVQDESAAALSTVQNFMAGEQVSAQLAAWGVPPDAIAERVAGLSETELQQLASTIEAQPAGGSALAVVGIVFVVFIILELVGITNIFRSF